VKLDHDAIKLKRIVISSLCLRTVASLSLVMDKLSTCSGTNKLSFVIREPDAQLRIGEGRSYQ
jgi:hypothetical protein